MVTLLGLFPHPQSFQRPSPKGPRTHVLLPTSLPPTAEPGTEKRPLGI